MHNHHVTHLDTVDLEASAVSPVFTDADGNPWASITIGGSFESDGVIVLHNNPADCNPLVLAEHFERLANDLRLEFARWVATPDSDTWCATRKVVATAEAITKVEA